MNPICPHCNRGITKLKKIDFGRCNYESTCYVSLPDIIRDNSDIDDIVDAIYDTDYNFDEEADEYDDWDCQDTDVLCVNCDKRVDIRDVLTNNRIDKNIIAKNLLKLR